MTELAWKDLDNETKKTMIHCGILIILCSLTLLLPLSPSYLRPGCLTLFIGILIWRLLK